MKIKLLLLLAVLVFPASPLLAQYHTWVPNDVVPTSWELVGFKVGDNRWAADQALEYGCTDVDGNPVNLKLFWEVYNDFDAVYLSFGIRGQSPVWYPGCRVVLTDQAGRQFKSVEIYFVSDKAQTVLYEISKKSFHPEAWNCWWGENGTGPVLWAKFAPELEPGKIVEFEVRERR